MPTDPRHLTKEAFDKSYDRVPPWEIGRPQSEILARLDRVSGTVLDVGCGTGELALELARRGCTVVAVDSSPKAIGRAKEKAATLGLAVEFAVVDALLLDGLSVTFDVVVDCGLFHVFSDDERPIYAAALARVLRPGGLFLLICFNEYETRDGGPRRVTQKELRDTFAGDCRIESIEPARFESLIHPGGAQAWLAMIIRA